MSLGGWTALPYKNDVGYLNELRRSDKPELIITQTATFYELWFLKNKKLSHLLILSLAFSFKTLIYLELRSPPKANDSCFYLQLSFLSSNQTIHTHNEVLAIR